MSIFMTVDTETSGTVENPNSLDCPRVYDLGIVIHTTTGKVLHTESLLIRDNFYDVKRMATAYYADKIPMYLHEFEQGKHRMVSFKEAKKIVRDLCLEYGVEGVCAYNFRFDNMALSQTSEELLGTKYFLPYGVNCIDTLKMARYTLKNNPRYKKFCRENGYMTKNNQLRYTAEIVYRYIAKNNEFIEDHTALSDSLIETQIFAYCMKRRYKNKDKEIKGLFFKENPNIKNKEFTVGTFVY